MKITILISLLFLFGNSNFGFSQNIDSVFYYNEDGTKSWWYLQPDVLLFRCQNDSAYTGYLDTVVIEELNFDFDDLVNFNEILFNSNATLQDLLAIKDSIINSGQLSIFAPVLTQYPYDPNVQQLYYRTDDQILVTFHNPLIDSLVIDSLMSEYSLELVHRPSPNLNDDVSWTYIFKMVGKPDTIMNSMLLANMLYMYEQAYVKIAQPNIIGGEPMDCELVVETSLNPNSTHGTWHIDNSGGLIWNGMNGTADADADICECWQEGFTGEGIKIGIIDVGGFEYDHPDLSTLAPGYDCIMNNGTYFTTNTYSDYDGHGMSVAGVIGATPNNHDTGEKIAVGVAFDAEIHPYLVGTEISSAQIVIALQKAIEDEVDIINMSFVIEYSSNIVNELNNARLVGRPDGNGGFLGIIMVATTGNDPDNTNSYVSNFPANQLGVIGVGMTNPDDLMVATYLVNDWSGTFEYCSIGGDPSYGYDVVAPGTLIQTIDLQGNNGDNSGDYVIKTGTSVSSPIVASIAALILEKNPNLTSAQVTQVLRDGAEKVHALPSPTGVYDYNFFPSTPGYDPYMFYGRVSCINSLNEVVGLPEVDLDQLILSRVGEHLYELKMDKLTGNQNLKLYNTLGELVWETGTLDSTTTLISLENYSNGMYILNLYEKGTLSANSKLVR
ncbi:MAG: peptidase and in kexin sedolisin [Fluviicola sp.]|jgi:subtilisin family serine protease|uniref:S8 family serine peptidase n=1 Tax=Fluviicola sp. TaxID=1917219 RepID=UPI00260CBD95|nr:S8 family serine peptidase [Fluviicola sp.]MDF3028695.1 peptidase and in kexin sedolisin [Fluviicola sp.]